LRFEGGRDDLVAAEDSKGFEVNSLGLGEMFDDNYFALEFNIKADGSTNSNKWEFGVSGVWLSWNL
jgi:hypothetical protein